MSDTVHIKESELRQFVYTYLSSRGYKTRDELQFDSESLSKLAVRESSEVNASIGNYINFFAEKENYPARYSESYAAMKKWIYESLDQYKEELAEILFPLFLHCFIELVIREFTDESREFFKQHSGEFVDLYSAEINSMAGIANTNLLVENELISSYRRTKVAIRMSAYSFELLVTFLQQQNFMLMLSIINEHMNIVVYARTPDEKSVMNIQGVTDDSDEEKDERGKKLKQKTVTPRYRPPVYAKVDLRPLHNEDISELSEYQRADVMGTPIDSEKSEKDKVKSERDEVGGVGGGEANEFGSTGAVSPVPIEKHRQMRIPLPKYDEDYELQTIVDSRKRVEVSSTALPSVVMLTLNNSQNAVNCADISEDGKTVVTGMGDSSLRLWEMTGGSVNSDGGLDASMVREASGLVGHKKLIGHSGAVFGVSISPNKDFILSCSEDTTIRLWHIKTRRNVVVYRGHNFPVWDVKFSPLGYYFASGSGDRTARIWVTDSIFPVRVCAGHLGDVECVEFHPNCHYLASGSADKSVRLWDVESGKCLRNFTKHKNAVSALAFSPDGAFLASASEDKTVCVWNIDRSYCVAICSGHMGPIYSLSFSRPDGNILVSGGGDCMMKIWDVVEMRKHDESETDKMVAMSTSTSTSTSPSSRIGVEEMHSDCLKTLYSKATPFFASMFTRRNLLVTTGPCLV